MGVLQYSNSLMNSSDDTPIAIPHRRRFKYKSVSAWCMISIYLIPISHIIDIREMMFFSIISALRLNSVNIIADLWDTISYGSSSKEGKQTKHRSKICNKLFIYLSGNETYDCSQHKLW